MEKKRNIAIIICIIIIIFLIGYSYAFFTAKTTGNSQSVSFAVDKLELTFNSGNEITSSFNPGSTSSKTFTITNTGKRQITYDLIWLSINNTLINKNDLVYSVSCSSNGSNCKALSQSEVPSSGSNIPIIESIVIAPNETQTFTIAYKYLNTNYEQAINNNTSFSGTIYISTGTLSTTYNYLEPKNLMNTADNNYLSYELLHNNNVITTEASLDKLPVSQTTYDSLEATDQTQYGIEIIGKESAIIENGLFKTYGDDGYYTYYFRGLVNNYIKLDGYNARIMRINEDGSIRITLNIDEDSEISSDLKSVWNSNTYNNSYSYLENEVYINSNMKDMLDNFYDKYLNVYNALLSYGSFCNDNSLHYYNFDSVEEIENGVLITNEFTMEELENMFDEEGITYLPESNYTNRRDYIIQLLYIAAEADPLEVTEEELLSDVVGSSIDAFIYRDKFYKYTFSCPSGANKYIYKIGLQTADEVVFSGIKTKVANNEDDISFGKNMFTMTANSSNNMVLFYDNNSVNVDIKNNNYSYVGVSSTFNKSISPVVNLKSDIKITGGIGSKANPYIIDLNS